MRHTIITVAAAFAALASCTKPGTTDKEPVTESSYIDATAKDVWQYWSFSQNKLVGSADDSANAEWFARNDWDIAISRYSIRTNSGVATTVGSQGGVYTFDASTAYADVTAVPEDAVFAQDKEVTSEGMGGTTTTVKSEATVIVFKQNSDGSLVMPPVYLQAPVYIFRSADGAHCYKVLFTQYQNSESVSGHVKFDWAEIN